MFFVGVVENNVDTLKLGRCQVRIFGKHTDDRTEYPTNDLPWAQCVFKGPNISEQSDFSVPNNGDYVIISFLDSMEQCPIILGSIPKIVTELPDFTVGFSDPDQTYPDSDHLDESGISRLARNENISDTIIQDKKDDKKTGVDCAGTTFDEPETPYATEYPNNKVINTKHHVIELDDTSGAERIHIYHKSGSSIEFHPNGDQVEIVKAKKFLIIESDDNKYIGGTRNIHIEGDENKTVSGAQKEEIDSKEITTSADITLTPGGKLVINATGNVEVTAGGSVNVTASSVNLN